MIVYMITNKINGKRYVGQSISSLEDRWWRHVWDATKRNRASALHSAIRKYKKDNFEKRVLARCNSIEEMNHRETYYIKLFNTLSPNGYNLRTGGGNHTISEETRQKIINSLTPEIKQRMSESQLGELNHNFGKKASNETRQKQSARKKGVKKKPF